MPGDSTTKFSVDEQGAVNKRPQLSAEENYILAEEKKKSKPIEAREHYLSAAQSGHAQAQYQVGLYYFKGHPEGRFAKNVNQAAEYFKLAGDNGRHSGAQYMLAFYYDYYAPHKSLNEKKRELATKYYELAARQGHVDSVKRQHNHFVQEGSDDSVFLAKCKRILVDPGFKSELDHDEKQSTFGPRLNKEEKHFINYLNEQKELLLKQAQGNTDQAVVLALNSPQFSFVTVKPTIQSALNKMAELVDGDARYFSKLDKNAKNLVAPARSSTAAMGSTMPIAPPPATSTAQPTVAARAAPTAAQKKSDATVVSLTSVKLTVGKRKG